MYSTQRRDRGVALLYMILMLSVLVGFAALGTDWARVQLVKMQLRNASDAAARAGAAALSAGQDARSAAIQIAGENWADGTPVVLDNQADIELGIWNSDALTFTPASDPAPANAVRVTARRVKSRGTAPAFAFSGLIGAGQPDVTASAIAIIGARQPFGVVGLDSISLSGSSSIDVFASSGSVLPGSGAASNGTISLSGAASIHADARPGVGHQVNGSSKVTGNTTQLSQPLVYPNGDASLARFSNDNGNIPAACLSNGKLSLSGNKSLVLPGGTYYLHDLSTSGNASLQFTGPARVYVWGSVSLSGGTETFANRAQNLSIILAPGPQGQTPGSVSLSGNSAMHASLHAPQSAVNISGTGDFYGSVVGKSITLSGNAAVHYDSALVWPGRITLVR